MAENAQRDERPSPTVYEHITLILESVAQLAWQKLGLQSDPMNGRLETNLAEAKVAIDLVAFLASQIEPQLDGEDRRQLQNLVSNLRINFVQRSQGGSA